MPNLNRKRSAAWNHFSVESLTIAKCSYCKEGVSYSGGSTSNLMRYLKTKHVTVPLKRPLLVNDDNIDDPSDLDVPASTSASVSTGSSRVVSEAAGPSASNLHKQSAITQYISKPISLTKSKAIDFQITKFIVKHFHPFSLVEETEFRNLIKMLAPNYIVPYDVSAVSLTTDGWTSINNQHFIALTVHFLNSETVEERPITSIVQSSTSIWKQFDEQVSSVLGQNNSSVACIVEVDKYLNENLLNRQLDPLKWWSERKLLYPRLYEMVKRRLCIPATSVPSERVFSKAGMVLNSKRTRLTT